MSKFARTNGTSRRARRTNVETMQLKLLDESGAPHADIYCGMTSDDSDPNRFTLTAMTFEITLQDKRVGTSVALEILRQLHIGQTQPWVASHWLKEAIELEVWPEKVLVVFRKCNNLDDGIVRLSHRKNRFQMSLPNSAQWSNCGLSWIYAHRRCWKEKQNPTPWFGRICDCKPPIVKYRLRR